MSDMMTKAEAMVAEAVGKFFSVRYKVGTSTEIKHGHITRCEIAGVRQRRSSQIVQFHVWINNVYVGTYDRLPR